MDLTKSYELRIEREERFKKVSRLTKAWISNLKNNQLIFAIHSFFESGDLIKAKQHFNICGMLDAFKIKNYQDRMFDYDIPSVCYAFLSDNQPFLKNIYANLTYEATYLDDKTREPIPITMEENVQAGEPAIYCHTIQQFIKGNTKIIERNLQIIKNVTLPEKSQNPELMQIDYEFYKALLEKNKSRCEKILDQLISPKIHKKRNDDPLLSQFVSQPALGYAKLAWMNGIEVEVNSPLIPKELLPIKPLDNYEVMYDFLKKT